MYLQCQVNSYCSSDSKLTMEVTFVAIITAIPLYLVSLVSQDYYYHLHLNPRVCCFYQSKQVMLSYSV